MNTGSGLRWHCALLPLALVCTASQAVTLDCAASGPLEYALPSGAPLRVDLQTATPAWLWIEERGHDLRFETSVQAQFDIQTPPRHGLSLLRIESSRGLEVARLRAADPQARVALSLHCGPLQPDLERWLADAHLIAARLRGGIGSLAEVAEPASLAALVESAPAPRWQALGLHLQAQWRLLAGRSQDAARAFTQAGAAWESIGAIAQAAAARVAAAESLRLAGRGAEVLPLSRAAPGAPDRRSYFGVRLEAARCGALLDSAELAESARCYAWVQQAYASLGESLEAANAAINHADLLRREGRLEDARTAVLGVLPQLTGPQSEAVRGRAELSLAETAFPQGDIAEVLARLRSAQMDFQRAGEFRWQAHVLRRLASTLADLGSIADARIALEASQSLIDPSNAPLPFAAGQVLQARLLRGAGEWQRREALIEAATRAGTAAGQQALVNAARLEEAELALETGNPARALAALQRIDTRDPRELGHAKVLRARAQGRTDVHAEVTAPVAVGGDGHAPAYARLGLALQVDGVRALAHRTASAGDTAAASAQLLDSARTLNAWAARSGSTLLQQALASQIHRLRSTAIELLAQEIGGASVLQPAQAAQIVEWLDLDRLGRRHAPGAADTSALGPTREGSGPETAARLDAALGRLLLGQPGRDRADALLQQLASASPGGRSERPRPALKAALDAAAPILILLGGERRALAIEWSAAGANARVIEDLPALLQAAAHLAALARAPASPLPDIAAAGAELANRLGLTSTAGELSLPSVLAEDLALKVEWSLLPDAELGFVGLARPVRLLQPSESRGHLQFRRSIELLQAAQWQSLSPGTPEAVRSQLPALRAVEAEASRLRRQLIELEIRATPLSRREQLLRSLATPDHWVHVSAHGQLAAGVVAGSGLWLDPDSTDAEPEFMSAIDVLAHGVAAEHVVLNACQLADNSADATHQASFAQSVVKAGAAHVIASRWIVSDSASQLWVPAYYAALQKQADEGAPLDPGAALVEARRSLQRSRAFRHPFHWAAWIHLQSLPLPHSSATASHANR